MLYTIENDFLSVTVSEDGAALTSVIRKESESEALWQADKEGYWRGQAPILFPFCGRLQDKTLVHKGKKYPFPQPHGFARSKMHTMVQKGTESITFVLHADDATRALYPFEFDFYTTYTLLGKTIQHTITVFNRGHEDMPFTVGYHPAYNCPFDDKHTLEDYSLIFSEEEPEMMRMGINPQSGLYTGVDTPCTELINKREIKLSQEYFTQNNAYKNIRSRTVSLIEKNTGRYIKYNIENFEFLLVWTTENMPVKFVCVEPWKGIPDLEGGGEFEKKTGMVVLKKDERFQCSLCMQIGN
ncbi:MAG: aldose 1-epimerase family protein [Oscillospiraceae bacterium]|nr:aldose 1-epimerase family protein [Oscillospiraceae bacterium]